MRCKVWTCSCLIVCGLREHPTHLWVDKALEYVDQLKPRRTYFTHIAHDIKHDRDSARLPAGVEFAYDGLVVE